MRPSCLPGQPARSPGPVSMSTSCRAVPVGLSARMAKRPGVVTCSSRSFSPAVGKRSRSSVAAPAGIAGRPVAGRGAANGVAVGGAAEAVVAVPADGDPGDGGPGDGGPGDGGTGDGGTGFADGGELAVADGGVAAADAVGAARVVSRLA